MDEERSAAAAWQATDARSAGGGVVPLPVGTRTRLGSVALVGAGPGDPDLMTLRAARLVAACDVLVYDRLVAPQIVATAPRAEKIYVGKAAADHAMPQSRINALLVALGRAGKRVVRLKGGDPFVFGRGGEEAEALAAAGVPFEIVPGVTAACGVAAYAGIPLTHRDHANALTFVTGHLHDDRLDLDWDALARPSHTLVVYMGLAALPTLCRELVAHGLPADTPAAVVEHGTTPRQRVVAATLAELPAAAVAAQLAAPTLIIVGSVTRLAKTLAWFAPDAAASPRGQSARARTAAAD